jgi:hypothetical protein
MDINGEGCFIIIASELPPEDVRPLRLKMV